MEKLKVLDLFSGIGGFSVGLERTGKFETIAFCEINKDCHPILNKTWPEVQIFDDVRTLDYHGSVDVICGGFPCQDLSSAGAQAGIQGERSGLFIEMLRLACIHRPKFILFENVTALLSGECGKWFSSFLSELAKVGYDAQWHCISASAVGAIHHRDRVWIIAYPSQIMPNGATKIYNSIASQVAKRRTPSSALAILAKVRKLQFTENEPDHRVLDGVSTESHAHGSLGNAIVPDIAEIIGNAIYESKELF